MNTAKKIYQSDEQGVVHLDLPVGGPGRRVEVLVVWTDADERTATEGEGEGVPQEEDWSDVVGLLGGVDDFKRQPQGEYEKRMEME